ncbi:acetyl-CoA C-acyltransferase, partial [Streptomyces sp. tea 10]|nr:acetyl-CoA C-acyltransferase [Streptomyces sp. tea 10]
CATGMETVSSIANKLRLGQIQAGIAGGVDSSSDAPIAVSEGLRRALLKLQRAKTTAQKLKAFKDLRPGDLAPSVPSSGEPRTGLSMGEHQALTTQKWGITREAQDELAAARQGVVGMLRSIAQEMRGGVTANGILLADDVAADAPGVTGALRFFLSGRSAYVDGQFLTVGDDRGDADVDWVHPVAGKVAVVTGAARGIGAQVTRTLAA